MSFVSEESTELAGLVEDACLNGLCTFEETFSRNRKLRRRLRAKSTEAMS